MVFSDPGFQGLLAVLEEGVYPCPQDWGFPTAFVGSLRPLKMVITYHSFSHTHSISFWFITRCMHRGSFTIFSFTFHRVKLRWKIPMKLRWALHVKSHWTLIEQNESCSSAHWEKRNNQRLISHIYLAKDILYSLELKVSVGAGSLDQIEHAQGWGLFLFFACSARASVCSFDFWAVKEQRHCVWLWNYS